MKTLLIGQLPPPRHGMSSAFEVLVNGFKEKNLAFTIVDASPGKHNRKMGSVSLTRVWQSIIYLLKVLWEIPTHKNIYIITAITQVGFLKDFPILICASFLKKHLVVHVHSGGFGDFYHTESSWMKKLIRYSYSRISDLIILETSFAKQFTDFLGRGMKIHVVGNCVPYNVEEESVHQKMLGEKQINILYLSNLFESKGYLDVLDAVEILAHTHGKKAKAHFCGGFHPYPKDGKVVSNAAQEQAFFHKITDYDLEEIALYHSFVDGEEKEILLKEAHVMVLPTYYPLEGQPISLIEGLAYALPLVGTEYRGLKSLIIEGKNGFFVPQKTPEAIAEAIMEITSSEEAYLQYSMHSRQLFNEHFHKDVHLSKLIPIIIEKEQFDSSETGRL